MTINVSLTDLANLQNQTTAVTDINNNNDAIETAFGSAYNTAGDKLLGNMDANNQQILNLPNPTTNDSPLRVTDLNKFIGGGTISTVPAGGTTGQVLAKTSNTDYAMSWENAGAAVTSVGLSLPSTDFTISNSPVTSTGTLTAIWANTPTGTGSVVRQSNPNIITPTIQTSLGIEGSTSGTTLVEASSIASGTLTLPATTDTLVAQATTDTLTNKTISGSSNTFSNVPLSSLSSEAANTLVGNVTGSSASPTAFTIGGLTQKASPAASDLVLLQDQAASGALKFATVSTIGSAGSVSSIAGNTGAFTLAGGVTNSTNQIQADGNYTGYNVPNSSLTVSASAGALTINLTDNGGNTPSATSPVYINFRNSNSTALGNTTLVPITSATSIVLPASSTLGISSSTACRIWVVAFNNSGTVQLGVINCWSGLGASSFISPIPENIIENTTAVSSSATSAGVFYTTSALTNKVCKIIGYLEWGPSGMTAGTWTTTNLLYVQNYGPGIPRPGTPTGNRSFISSSGSTNTSASFANVTGSGVSISPSSAVNPILVHYTASGSVAAGGSGSNSTYTGQLIKGSSTVLQTGIIGVVSGSGTNSQTEGFVTYSYLDTNNSTSTVTYQLQHHSTTTGATVSVTTSSIIGWAEEIMV